jgi:hypothetical protein
MFSTSVHGTTREVRHGRRTDYIAVFGISVLLLICSSSDESLMTRLSMGQVDVSV